MIYGFFRILLNRPMQRKDFAIRAAIVIVLFALCQIQQDYKEFTGPAEIPILIYLAYIVIRRCKDLMLPAGSILVLLFLLYIPYLSLFALLFLCLANSKNTAPYFNAKAPAVSSYNARKNKHHIRHR